MVRLANHQQTILQNLEKIHILESVPDSYRIHRTAPEDLNF